MARYVNRNQLTVSQEFTLIELAIGLGIGMGIYKLLKKQSNEASASAKKIENDEDREKFETSISRYNTLIESAENATSIHESVMAQTDIHFGGAKDGAAVLYHLNKNVVSNFTAFLNQTEPLVEKLMKMSAGRNSSSPIDSKGAIEVEFQKLLKIIQPKETSLAVNGFSIHVRGTGREASIESSIDYGRNDDLPVKCPTPEQFQKLLVLAGSLLKLVGRTAEEKNPEGFSDSYLSHDMQYIGWLNEMLDHTLYSLTGYLLHSIGK